MKQLALAIGLAASAPAFGDYACQLNYDVNRTSTWGSQSHANGFCNSWYSIFDVRSGCKVERRYYQGYRQYRAVFALAGNFKYRSNQSWEHSRSHLFGQFGQWFEARQIHRYSNIRPRVWFARPCQGSSERNPY